MMESTPTPARVRHFIIGDGKGSAFRLSHGLDTSAPVVQVYQRHEPFFQIAPAGIQAVTTNEVAVHFSTPPESGEYIVVIVG